jgi:hypothetical protein
MSPSSPPLNDHSGKQHDMITAMGTLAEAWSVHLVHLMPVEEHGITARIMPAEHNSMSPGPARCASSSASTEEGAFPGESPAAHRPSSHPGPGPRPLDSMSYGFANSRILLFSRGSEAAVVLPSRGSEAAVVQTPKVASLLNAKTFQTSGDTHSESTGFPCGSVSWRKQLCYRPAGCAHKVETHHVPAKMRIKMRRRARTAPPYNTT